MVEHGGKAVSTERKLEEGEKVCSWNQSFAVTIMIDSIINAENWKMEGGGW